jgi:hypothetical protein
MNIGKSEIKIINKHYFVTSSLAELTGVSVIKLPTGSFSILFSPLLKQFLQL